MSSRRSTTPRSPRGRVAFNWGLGRVKANLSQREAEASYAPGRRRPDTLRRLVVLRAAQGVARRLGHGRAVVGGELERGLRDRPGTPRPSAQELVGIAAR